MELGIDGNRTGLRNLIKFNLKDFEMDTVGPVEKLLLEFKGENTKIGRRQSREGEELKRY